MSTFAGAPQRFVRWFDERALPLWAGAAWDGRRGGFHEALDFDGAPRPDLPRRVRVQSRQTHVFASAAALGLHPQAEGLARAGFDYLLARAAPGGGARGCVHLLAPDGQVLDAKRDLYDQAFLLLACAAIWRAFRDDRALDLANRTLAFMDAELASPAGGWREDDRGALPRRQNPHMHLFEAFLALHEATGEAAWRARAVSVADLFETHFFNAGEGRLVEFFDETWRQAEGKAGEVIEPGHMAEWAALLEKFSAAGEGDFFEIQRTLWERAGILGADASGFLVDRVIAGEAAGGSRRLWPQTEHLRASLVLARRPGAAPVFADHAEALSGALLATYLSQPVAGLWCDHYDSAGRPIAADVPASILYHLFEASLEARRFLGEKPA